MSSQKLEFLLAVETEKIWVQLATKMMVWQSLETSPLTEVLYSPVFFRLSGPGSLVRKFVICQYSRSILRRLSKGFERRLLEDIQPPSPLVCAPVHRVGLPVVIKPSRTPPWSIHILPPGACFAGHALAQVYESLHFGQPDWFVRLWGAGGYIAH